MYVKCLALCLQCINPPSTLIPHKRLLLLLLEWTHDGCVFARPGQNSRTGKDCALLNDLCIGVCFPSSLRENLLLSASHFTAAFHTLSPLGEESGTLNFPASKYSHPWGSLVKGIEDEEKPAKETENERWMQQERNQESVILEAAWSVSRWRK